MTVNIITGTLESPIAEEQKDKFFALILEALEIAESEPDLRKYALVLEPILVPGTPEFLPAGEPRKRGSFHLPVDTLTDPGPRVFRGFEKKSPRALDSESEQQKEHIRGTD